jgi:6-phosphofructokinase
MKRLMVATSGGDCPGLNAVIRGIVKRAQKEREWEVLGSYRAYDGVLIEPMELIELDDKAVAGIHIKGGTILSTTNKGGPFAWPVKKKDGSYEYVDRSDEFLRRLSYQGIDAVISIGGDGSQTISQKLYERVAILSGSPKRSIMIFGQRTLRLVFKQRSKLPLMQWINSLPQPKVITA